MSQLSQKKDNFGSLSILGKMALNHLTFMSGYAMKIFVVWNLMANGSWKIPHPVNIAAF
jgi:hypothetical protein